MAVYAGYMSQITHQVLILAPGGSRGHSKDWTVTLENGPSPSALRGAVATVGGGLASAFKPRLRLRQGPPSGIQSATPRVL